jgi:aryl-alcohol dehydrogenase-like predicted oxidoreductase
MNTRSLGTIDQESTILTFGAIALSHLEQSGADRMVELMVQNGVNHVDVAPTYGDAELKLGPKLRQHRDDLFLGCKTQERDYGGAREELQRSLDRLGVDTIDLYQFHALGEADELETITGAEGALEAFREAKAEGTIEHIGLTSHGEPELICRAIDRIEDLESVMFPLNPVLVGRADTDYEAVLERADDRGIGTLAIKGFARGTWPPDDELHPDDRAYSNWYEPVETPQAIRRRFDFAAAQGVTSVVSPGDPKLVAMALDAARRYDGMSPADQRSLVDRQGDRGTPVPPRE